MNSKFSIPAYQAPAMVELDLMCGMSGLLAESTANFDSHNGSEVFIIYEDEYNL